MTGPDTTATTPAHIVASLAASIRTGRMVPYDDGKGGTLYRGAKSVELAEHLARDVVQPLIDAALADIATMQRETGRGLEQVDRRRAAGYLEAANMADGGPG